MKLSKDDYRILHAALQVAIEGDHDAWDELSGEEIDRAEEIRDFLALAVEQPEDEDDDEDPWDEDEDGVEDDEEA